MTTKLGCILSIAFLAMALGAGCGYGPTDYCDDACDCSGCSSHEYDDCVDYWEGIERDADHEGCNDQVSDLEACASDTGYCRSNGVWETDCGPENSRLNNCLH